MSTTCPCGKEIDQDRQALGLGTCAECAKEFKPNAPKPRNVDNRVVRCVCCGKYFHLREQHVCQA